MIFYRREDGVSLTVATDGAFTVGGTGSVAQGTISETLVISLTSALNDAGVLEVGASALIAEDPILPGDEPVYATPFVLGLRRDTGVFSLGWEGPAPEDLMPALAILEAQIDSLLPVETATPVVTPSPSPEP